MCFYIKPLPRPNPKATTPRAITPAVLKNAILSAPLELLLVAEVEAVEDEVEDEPLPLECEDVAEPELDPELDPELAAETLEPEAEVLLVCEVVVVTLEVLIPVAENEPVVAVPVAERLTERHR